MDMFFPDDDDTMEVDDLQIDLGSTSQSFEELIKDFMLEENQYLRDLNMIIRVFRDPFVRLYPRSKVWMTLVTGTFGNRACALLSPHNQLYRLYLP